MKTRQSIIKAEAVRIITSVTDDVLLSLKRQGLIPRDTVMDLTNTRETVDPVEDMVGACSNEIQELQNADIAGNWEIWIQQPKQGG